MITLAAASTLRGLSGTTTAITASVFGDELSAGADAFKKLYQGQLATSVATLYTVPGSTQTLIKTIILDNTTASPATATLYVDGTAASNRICSFTIPAGGEAVWSGDGWKMLDANGATLTAASGSGSAITDLTGDVTATGPGSVAATIAADAVSNTKLANMAQATIKGRAAGAGTGDPTDLTEAQVIAILATAFPLGVGAWSTYTPTLTQSATVTKTINWAHYTMIGKTVIVSVRMTVTGSGTASNAVQIGLPVTGANASLPVSIMGGVGFITDNSAVSLYQGTSIIENSGDAVGLLSTDGTANVRLGQAGAPFAAGLAVNDAVAMFAVYEAA